MPAFLEVTLDHEPHDATVARPRKRGRDTVELAVGDQKLFEDLRYWRAAEAKRQHVPPYVIFPDRTLAEIAQRRPRTSSTLLAVSGVGEGKLARYGAEVIAVVEKSL